MVFNVTDQIRHIKKLSDIGIALSLERDINKLFEMIVEEAKSFCNADAGTLYIVNEDQKSLKFEIMQNDALDVRKGGVSGDVIEFPDVPLYIDGHPNYANVSSYVALTKETVNISDVYQVTRIGQFKNPDFTGTRKYDEKTGYLTKSMLVIPMKNHENTVIGVLQLINAQDQDLKQVVDFPTQIENVIASLASQAAVALTNVQLIKGLKDLFYAIIESIAAAVDEKSPYTGGHINRVVELTMMIAEAIHACDQEPFKDVFLNENEMEELRIAAWMHDVGKITIPEHIMDKSTKLESIFDRLQLIETRFAYVEEKIKTACLREKIDLMEKGVMDQITLKSLDEECSKTISQIRNDFEFVASCNQTGDVMSDKMLARLQTIAKKTFQFKSQVFPLLSQDEMANLSIRKGTLTEKERKIIENHSQMTYKITSQLPFPKNLAHVPEYAASHHEKINGSGYPKGLSGDELSLQSRIMTIADVFDALTAKDRPYKKAMPLSQAIKILRFMTKDQHIDPDIFDLFLTANLHSEHARNHLNPDQIDI
ncbi:MAG: HD domain-containing protein [Proteobacteria bacterium]|nr:HD domain-containing protein [Pseudomonadota bacterium]MBU1581795.1 HD domain-containing protein [Pseudomonadota bacterium]MBU2452251.1 HD domain-containing protein [Pseudomonadota bacterium]MBU2629290.1 HD domain-containing protein [Pseudomonadota bacterium]